MKYHDITTGKKNPKSKALKGAKELSVNPSWMPLKSDRAESVKRRMAEHRASVMKNYPKGLTTTGTKIK